MKRALLALAALALPWPLVGSGDGRFLVHLMITFLIWAAVAQAWNLILAYGGIASFAQLALYGVGGYTTAVLSMRLGVSPWLGLAAAPFAAVAASLVIGLPTLRLRGVYVVLLTLAFHELLRTFVTSGPAIISNGGFGLLYVPKLVAPGQLSPGGEAAFHYSAALLLFAATTGAIGALLRSPVGLAFQALRDAETYASSRGVDGYRFRLLIFATSAFFTGLAGAFMTHYQGAISPATLGFGALVNLLAMVVIGGWGTRAGPIVGAAVVTALPELFHGLADHRTLAFGAALLLLSVLAPQGLVPLAARHFADLARVWRPSRGPERVS